MTKLMEAFINWFISVLGKYLERIADGINERSGSKIVANIAALLIFLAFWVGITLLLCFFAYRMWYIILCVFIIGALISETFKKEDSEQSTNPTLNDVDKLLVRQRANELYDSILQYVYIVVQAVAGHTPLSSPTSSSEIRYPACNGNYFYLLNDLIPVFRFDVALSVPVDDGQLELIFRELQIQLAKHSDRFMFLRSADAEGRPPIEIIDLKNMGGSVVIEVVQTTAASIPLIDAARRAHAERQIANRGGSSFYDRDF